ncbi:MAG TPA: hypothetical protein PKY81_04865 [bacterium]|nr:hypothetical protein [bacterium]HPN30267.1 hypothetical protein [bacterium]
MIKNFSAAIFVILIIFVSILIYRFGNPVEVLDEISGTGGVFASFIQTFFFFAIGIVLFSALCWYFINGDEIIANKKMEFNKRK